MHSAGESPNPPSHNSALQHHCWRIRKGSSVRLGEVLEKVVPMFRLNVFHKQQQLNQLGNLKLHFEIISEAKLLSGGQAGNVPMDGLGPAGFHSRLRQGSHR